MAATLLLGDCLDLLRTLPDASVDAVIADPPYGTTACKWDAVIPFAPMWEQLRRVAKPNAAIVLTASQPFSSALVMSNPKAFRHEWIARKTIAGNHLNAKRGPLKLHDHVLVFGVNAPHFYPQMSPRSSSRARHHRATGHSAGGIHFDQTITRVATTDDGLVRGYPSSVLDFKSQRGLHPTQKSIPLFAYLIRTYTNPGDTVLDFCAGSFTTGVACVNEGRDFIGIERDGGYFRSGEQRIGAAIARATGG